MLPERLFRTGGEVVGVLHERGVGRPMVPGARLHSAGGGSTAPVGSVEHMGLPGRHGFAQVYI